MILRICIIIIILDQDKGEDHYTLIRECAYTGQDVHDKNNKVRDRN